MYLRTVRGETWMPRFSRRSFVIGNYAASGLRGEVVQS